MVRQRRHSRKSRRPQFQNLCGTFPYSEFRRLARPRAGGCLFGARRRRFGSNEKSVTRMKTTMCFSRRYLVGSTLALPMNLVAADMSPLHPHLRKVRADSRRLLRFKGSVREFIGGILTPSLSPEERVKLWNGFNLFHLSAKFCAAIFMCSIFLTLPARAAANYSVHEWGTFTSVQGGNGELLSWRPLQTSELPGFVYNFRKAGMNRGLSIGFKGD